MREARLIMLADRHAQPRKVISRTSGTSENSYSLECGHTIKHAPHFALSDAETMNCRECGRVYVRTAPQYAKEFDT